MQNKQTNSIMGRKKTPHNRLFCCMSFEAATANMLSFLTHSLLKWVVAYESLDIGVSGSKRRRNSVNEMKVGQSFREQQERQQHYQSMRGLFQSFRERTGIVNCAKGSGTCCLTHVLEIAYSTFVFYMCNMNTSSNRSTWLTQMEHAISRHPAELLIHHN